MHKRKWLGWGLSWTLAAVSCSNPSAELDAPSEVKRRAGPARVDQPGNGRVSVDEAKLHATEREGQIALEIPVRGLAEGRGSLIAELVTVDGSEVLSTIEVPYVLTSDEQKLLAAKLRLPDDVEQQADRARYSVRVRDDRWELRVTRSLMYVLTPFELVVDGPSQVRAERQGSYRVRAQAVPTRAPLIDQAVSVEVTKEGEVAQTLHATTDDDGSAVFALELDEPGAYALAVASSSETLSSEITVRAAEQKLLLTTDKPLYQPGQTMHLRALALQSPDNRPVANTELVFEVSDGKGNKVFKKSRKTDDFGIASVDFKLATLVNMGSYKLQVSGAGKTEKTVEVSRYVLPKFELKVATDRGWYKAGDKLHGTVDGRYFFGKLVSGADVVVEGLTLDVGSELFQRVMGKLDAQGRFAFTLDLPEVLAGVPIQNGHALVTLRAQVTDTAGQVVSKETAVTVAQSAIQLSLVPEATQVVPGLENRFHLFATDPLGAPIPDAEVELTGGAELSARTDKYGHAELSWQVENGARTVTVALTTEGGESAQASFDFAAQSGGEHVLVRTDKSLYQLGESVKVQVIGTRAETRAYVDWLNDGQIVDMRRLDLEDGVASFEVALDSGFVGDNRIEAFVVDDAGNSVRAGRSIVVQGDGALHVSLSQDKPEYRPGEPAKLTFSVTDEAGKPAPGALGVQIVDEAVFSLIDARPGLLRTFFELENSFAMPQYELHAPQVSFERLLFEDAASALPEQQRAAQAQVEAQLSALRGQHMLGVSRGTWDSTVQAALKRLDDAFTAEHERIQTLVKPLATTVKDELAAKGCTPQQNYCSAQNGAFSTLFSNLLLAKNDLYDFWGNRYAGTAQSGGISYTSAGPDERQGTSDDRAVKLMFHELGAAFSGGDGFIARGGAAPQVAAAPDPANAAPTTPVTGAQPVDEESAGSRPRVRSEFPETLYVHPALITDAEGKASVSLDMADSITSWRVSALANAKNGSLGGGQGAITVFQDFFVDVAFPAELTRGDQIEFPVVVYNYLKTEQTVRIELEQAAWFSALGATSTSVTLAADSVQSVKIPVRVERVGAQTLTVRAIGASASDAVARSVRVVPDGERVAQAQSGSIERGSHTLDISVPSDAIEGSPELYVDIYPGFTSQVAQGLDSMLQVPNGCFEQTTSTTWPNVLITRYLERTKQSTQEIQLKAEALIAAGYQRLLTFEHRTGGFSWFGEQDGKADLSVTAFGLMEFADMGKVAEVDPDMVARTQAWLAAQQAGDGTFPAGQTEFFSFHTGGLRNTAFTAWAFAEGGYKGDALDRALTYVRDQLDSDTDTYTLALAANALASGSPNSAELRALLDKLDEARVEEEGKVHWRPGTQQIGFYGGGRDSEVSTTALIAHAMIRAGAHGPTANAAIQYLISSKDPNGNFGSTQATIWTLKALMLAAERGLEPAAGALSVLVDGQAFANVQLKKSEADLTTRVDMSSLALPGEHSVSIEFAGTGQVSYNLVSTHHVPWRTPSLLDPPAGPLAIAVSYDRAALSVDETVSAHLTITNLTSVSQSMLLVTVGLPPGFELQTDALDGFVAAGQISRYERTAKQLILYVTRIEPAAVLALDYRLLARMTVRAADGGSEVALYYQPDQKASSPSTTLVVTGN